MDRSIRLITPEQWQDRGYTAFLDGHGPDDHGLTDPAAIKLWKFGWHTARIEQQQDRERIAKQLRRAA